MNYTFLIMNALYQITNPKNKIKYIPPMCSNLSEGPKRHTWNVIFSKNFIIFTVLSHFTRYVPRLKSSLHHTVVVFVNNCPKTVMPFCLLNPWTKNQFNQKNIKYLVKHLCYDINSIFLDHSFSIFGLLRHSTDQKIW